MPENNENTAETVVEPQDQSTSFDAITSQEELDKIIQKRLARERSKYADYDELAAKAARFDESVEANKSELEKAIGRAEQAEKQLQARELEATRFQIIAEFNLPADLHELVTGADVDEMRERAEKLAAYAQPKANLHQVVSTDGKRPGKEPRSIADTFADAFEGRI